MQLQSRSSVLQAMKYKDMPKDTAERRVYVQALFSHIKSPLLSLKSI